MGKYNLNLLTVINFLTKKSTDMMDNQVPPQQQMGQPQYVGMPPGQQMQMMPQEVYIPMHQKLLALPGVYVKQKFDLMEALTGCERENTYYVYARDKHDKDKKKGKKLFKYKEKSSFYERCLTGSCKPFKMKCKNEQQMAGDEYCMRCQKDCACTYLCFNRTKMVCWYTEAENKNDAGEAVLGSCYDPWDCVNFSFKLLNEKDECKYFIKASCCQCYFWMRCPCETCQLVVFKIHEGDNAGANEVGELRRTGRDCLKQAVMGDDADEFSVDFPDNSDWVSRAMLMNLVVFIDYTMFEDSSDQQQKGQH